MVATYNDGLVTHEYNYVEPKKKELFLTCACESELLRAIKWEDEDEIYLSVYSFSAQKYSLWERIKILFGGKTKTTDIILTKKTFDKLKKIT